MFNSRIVQRCKKGASVLSAIVAGCLVLVANAQAAIPVGVTELSTADVDTIMGFVIVALATMWAYRKVVKTMNRS